MIRYEADGRAARATSDEPLTTGSVGVPVVVELSEDFEGLQVTVVFDCGGRSADVPLLGQAAIVPSQLLRHEGNRLRMGAWGALPDGTVVIPTVWADVGTVREGVEPSGIDPAQPAPSWAAQVQEAAERAASEVSSVSERVEMLEDVSVSMSPFFARKPPEGGSYSDDYWTAYNPVYLTDTSGGWAHWHEELGGSVDGMRWSHELFSVAKSDHLRPGRGYTFVLEVRNLTCVAGDESEPPYIFVSAGRDGSGYDSQVYDPEQVLYHIAHDGEYVMPLVGSLVQDRPNLIRVSASSISGSVFECDIRASLYSGEHEGGFVACPPCIGEDVEGLSATVAELSSEVATLNETVGGVSSDVSALSETATALTDGLTEVSDSVRHLGDNLSPFFEHARDSGEGRYWQQLDNPWTILEDGWARFEYDNDGLGGRAFVVRPAPIDQYRRASLVPGNRYTLLVETRSYQYSGEHAELYVQSEPDSYMPSPDLLAVWNGSGNDFYTELRNGDGVMYYVEMFATDGESATETLLNLYVRVPQYSSASFEMRLSLFEGDYSGPWKPCVWCFRDSMADMISANMAPEDVSSGVAMNADLHIYHVTDKYARRAVGIVTVNINILLNQEVVVGHEADDRSVVVATLSGRATPPDPSQSRGPEYTYLSTNIPGIKAFVNGREGTIELGADSAVSDVTLGDNYYRNRVIISGAYLVE